MPETSTQEITAQLAEMKALIQEQRDMNAALSELVQSQRAEIDRLKSFTPLLPASGAPTVGTPKVGRRGWLKTLAGATAAAALLTVAKETPTARADARGTIVGPSTAANGFAATYGVGVDPASHAPNLNGYAFAILGTNDDSSITTPVPAGVFGSGRASSGVLGLSRSGYGVIGKSLDLFGVHGASTNYAGVGGVSQGLYGVWGQTETGMGVYGEALTSGNGVYGKATQTAGYGVVGRGPGIAIYGISDSPSSAPKEAIRGESTYGPGVYGKSVEHAGVYSQGGGGNIALFGITATGTAMCGQATSPGGQAGLFLGNVNIIGNLTVSGSFPKSAGVPHPDGSTRRMYCLEGPESAFEDWGRGQLQGGRAEVQLDPDFASLVTADDYSVFLQAEGPTTGLYVSRRTPTSFEVREQQADSGAAERSVRPVASGGTVGFSYRLLAKRKDLVGKHRRLEKIDMPRGVRRGGARNLMADNALLPPPPDAPRPEPPTPPDRREPQPGER